MGRIGGDEFVVFSAIPSLKWLGEKAVELNGQLQYSFVMENKSARISASIGTVSYTHLTYEDEAEAQSAESTEE